MRKNKEKEYVVVSRNMNNINKNIETYIQDNKNNDTDKNIETNIEDIKVDLKIEAAEDNFNIFEGLRENKVSEFKKLELIMPSISDFGILNKYNSKKLYT
jgi:hypothetical protein